MGFVRRDPVWRDSLIIVLAYTLAWGLLVVNRGIYWDDWTSVGVSPASLAVGLREIGAVPWVAFFSVALYSMPLPGLVGHIIVYSAYLLSTLALHAILRRTPGLSRMDALVAALTFAVLPVNYARVALADLPYGLSLLAFLAATLLLIRYVEDGGLARRAVALGLYFSSFFTASLLVMYVMPMALAAFIVWKSARMRLRSFVWRHADFVVLPVAYWLFKSALFAPSGVYEGYNALTLGGLAHVPGLLPSIPSQVLLEPLSRAVSVKRAARRRGRRRCLSLAPAAQPGRGTGHLGARPRPRTRRRRGSRSWRLSVPRRRKSADHLGLVEPPSTPRAARCGLPRGSCGARCERRRADRTCIWRDGGAPAGHVRRRRRAHLGRLSSGLVQASGVDCCSADDSRNASCATYQGRRLRDSVQRVGKDLSVLRVQRTVQRGDGGHASPRLQWCQ